MSEKTVYGIDLGTTYSCVSRINKNDLAEIIDDMATGDRLTPSVVYFEDSGDPDSPNVVVGKAAKDYAKLDPDRVVKVVKRYMHDDDKIYDIDGKLYDPVSVSAEILKHLAAQASARIGSEVEDVVISVPAYFGTNERNRTIKAGEQAGLTVHDILPEPMAAALHYGVEDQGEQTVLVYDLGGGTFDVTIMAFEENFQKRSLATRGDHDLGGYLWDEALARHWAEQIANHTEVTLDEVWDDLHAREELFLAAEEAKKKFSGGMKKQSAVSSYNGQPFMLEIDIDTFNELTAGLLGRTISLVDEALAIAEGKSPDLKINKLLMVGGSSLMPQVKTKLFERFGPDVELLIREPHFAVAFGAAQYALQREVSEELIELMKLHVERYGDGDEKFDAENIDFDALPVGVQTSLAERTGRSIENIGSILEPKFIDVAPKSFGIRHLADDSVSEVVTNLICAQQEMPATGTKMFGTVEDNQSAVRLICVENERDQGMDDTPYPYDDSERIGEAVIELDHGLPAGSGIEVKIEFTSTGRVKLYGRDVVNGRDVAGEFAGGQSRKPQLSD